MRPFFMRRGIADMKEPSAQLDASFLNLFGAVIFDPGNTTVWLGDAREPWAGPANGR
jgi:hypothetical protein